MGEFSKTVGEKGERIVDEILNLFGWKSTPINESMQCLHPGEHKSDSSTRGKSTHGSDSFYIYASPFFTGQLDHVVISSKYIDKKYYSIPSKFKSHFTDLSHTIECYASSELRNLNNTHFGDIDAEQISGLLFWLSNDQGCTDKSILNQLNPDFDKRLIYETNYIVDSHRAAYLFDCITSAKSIYSDYKFEYYYIETGNNPADLHKRFRGNELPIQLIVSDIQVFKLSKDKEVIVALFVKENFSVENLSRLLGLAHNIAKGLATKINIHFPDYQPEAHDNHIYRVKRGFESSNIVDDINIRSYKNTFTSLGESSTEKKLPSLTERSYGELKHNQILPFGNELRDLLSRSQITPNELKKLLRKKGVYVSNPKKENLIPILSTILLSPQEFDYLKNHQKTREDSIKRSSSQPLPCSSDVSEHGLVNILDKIDLKKVVNKQFCDYKFHNNTLSFARVDGDPNIVKGTYKITKRMNNKIWFESKNEFTGTVWLKLEDHKLGITPVSNYTSSDTEFINNCIKSHIINDLKAHGYIAQDTEEKKILMSEMTNEEVIRFLLSFTDNKHGSEVIFEEIISLDTEIDSTVTLPKKNKIKWMENNINRFKFDGKNIEKIELITEKENHKYLKLWGMLCRFKLDSKLGKATFQLNFFFKKSGSHEFSFNIERISFSKGSPSKRKAKELIYDVIDSLKLEKHDSLFIKENGTKKPAQGELFPIN